MTEPRSDPIMRVMSTAHLMSPAPVRLLALSGMMAALLAVFSWISLPLPFSPVPVTLQTLGVLLAGALLGPRWGPVSVLVWIGLGLVGAPVYHNGLFGPAVAFGPTGGFVWSFPVAAFVSGLAARWSLRLPNARIQLLGLATGFGLAEIVFYAVGLPWLSFTTGMGLEEAALVGLLPFLPGDLLKLAAALVLTVGIGRALDPAATTAPGTSLPSGR
ncbi:MAG: biotin transporter BioY [Thermoleophilia bacterium]